MPEADEKSKIRPRRLEFVKFLAADYYMYAPPGCSPEEAGKVLQDLLVALYEGKIPTYIPNKTAVEEAEEYIARRKYNIAEWKRKKFGKKDGEKKNPEEDGGLFKKESLPEKWQEMERHELEKTLLKAGVTQEAFHRWYEDSKANDWRARDGKPIRNPIAACKAYSKFKPIEKEETDEGNAQ